jgi:DNA-directed RNA polymerase specialized sigma24 family protein
MNEPLATSHQGEAGQASDSCLAVSHVRDVISQDFAPAVEGETAKARTMAESAGADVPARLLADQALVYELAACNFAGPQYQQLEEELARYAISMLQGALSGHWIASLVRGVDYSEFQELFRDPDDRLELVLETVAEALPRFRRYLAAGSWQPGSGASLATYFIGTCRAVLPAKIRKYQIQRKLWLQLQDRRNELAGREEEAIDPEALVVGHMHVIDELGRLDQRTRAIVTLLINDFTAAEIAELLGESPRAVEGVLYRWRRAIQRRGRGD